MLTGHLCTKIPTDGELEPTYGLHLVLRITKYLFISSGHKVVLVIEGDADGYIFASAGCKRWDTCAGEAILEALGGKLTDVFGNLVTYDFEADDYVNKSGVIASLRDHDLYIKMIPDSVKEKLKV